MFGKERRGEGETYEGNTAKECSIATLPSGL